MTSPNDRDLARLRELCEQTAPPEPSAEKWDGLFRRISGGLRPSRLVRAERARALRRTALTLGTIAAAVLLAVLFLPKPSRDDADIEIFPVATASEIEIISVAGADRQALVVGQAPVTGLLELLAPGDVTVTNIQPSDRDMMRPQARDRTPMIWARLDTEVDD